MKKIVFLISMVFCAFTAQAVDYPYLVFTNTAGNNTILSVTNLTLTINGSDLQVTNDEGPTTFTLTELAAMQFSTDGTITGIENVLDAEANLQVFSISGVSLGSFGSLVEAVRSLPAGTYVISNGSVTQTIVVK